MSHMMNIAMVNSGGGGRIHRCAECQKAFLHPRNLQQHRRVMHEGVRYYCADCDHSYTRQYNLTNHRIKAHPEKVTAHELRGFVKKRHHLSALARNHVNSRFPTAGVSQAARRLLADARRRRSAPTPNNSHQFVVDCLEEDDVDEHVEQLPVVTTSRAAAPRATAHVLATSSASATELLNRLTCSSGSHKIKSSPPMCSSPAVALLRDTPLSGTRVSAKEQSKQPTPSSSLAVGEDGAKPGRVYQCLRCPFQTRDAAGFRLHFGRHEGYQQSEATDRRLLRCVFCDYKADNETAGALHSAVHFSWTGSGRRADGVLPTGLPSVKTTSAGGRCRHCDRMFRSLNDLDEHERRHDVGERRHVKPLFL